MITGKKWPKNKKRYRDNKKKNTETKEKKYCKKKKMVQFNSKIIIHFKYNLLKNNNFEYIFYCYCRQSHNSLVQNYAASNTAQNICQCLFTKNNDPGSVARALRINTLIGNVTNFREEISNGDYLFRDHIKIFHQIVENNTCFRPVNVFLIGALEFVIELPASTTICGTTIDAVFF